MFLVGAAFVAAFMYMREDLSTPNRAVRLCGAVTGALLVEATLALGFWIMRNWPFPWNVLAGAPLGLPTAMITFAATLYVLFAIGTLLLAAVAVLVSASGSMLAARWRQRR